MYQIVIPLSLLYFFTPPTTRTSQVVDSRTIKLARLSRAFAKLRQRLYVHRTTVMSMIGYIRPMTAAQTF